MAVKFYALFGGLFVYIGCNGGEAICYASSQTELTDRVADAGCSSVFLVDYPDEEVSASAERDVELVVTQSSSALRRVFLNHVGFTGAISLESLQIVDHQGSPLAVDADTVDVELGADVPESRRTFAVQLMSQDEVTLRVRAAGSMDGWTVRPTVTGSWESVTLDVDPSAQPTGTLQLQGSIGADMRLDQMQAFGSAMQRIEMGYVFPETTKNLYIDWLESSGFSGTLILIESDNTETVLLPR